MTSALVSAFRLQVFGSPSLKDAAGVTPPALGWGKPLALLCLLAVRGEARREEVVDLLWRDVDEAKARNAFRQALHRLRGALGDDLIPLDREVLKLVRSERLAIDLDEFEKATVAGRYEESLQLYAGDYLENATLNEPAFDHWAEQERLKRRVAFQQVLRDAVMSASAAGDWTAAVARARRLLALTPFETSAAQLAATTLISSGRRLEAQELLRQFAARLQSELGLPVPPEVQSQLSRIERQDRLSMAAAPTLPVVDTTLTLPFAGRSAELSQLMTLWRTTASDAGALTLIEGAPGVGKTRLVRELAAHARSLGPVSVLLGSERAAGASLPYGVWAEALRPLANAKGILGASRHLLAEAARLLPELRDKADLPATGDVKDEADRLRFFEGIAALIDAAAFEQPILISLENLHLVQPASLDLLNYLAVRLTGSAVMIVLTLRPGDAPAPTLARLRALAEPSPAGHPPHGGRARALRIGVPERDAMTEIAGRAASDAGIPRAQLDRALERSQGNPALLVELLRRAAAHEEIAGLPLTVRDLVAARLERLSSADRRALLALALIGRPTHLRALANASHLPEQAARDSIRQLVAARLVESTDDEIAMSASVSEIVLELAGAAGRAFLAGWVGDALAAERDASSAELARLYAVAGQADRAFEHSRRAAFEALALGAPHEATQFLVSARTFARTTEEQREVESLLAALGSGRRRLQATPTAEVPTPIRSSGDVSRQASPRWLTLFPNWRLLLGGAVATLVIAAGVLAARPTPLRVAARQQNGDTLVVTEAETGRERYVTANADGFSISDGMVPRPSHPAWLDSVSRPWIDPIADPRGRSVAIANVTPNGADVFVISSDRRDTVPLIVGRGDGRPLGWSPDGHWLLVSATRTLRSGTFDTDLYAYNVGASKTVIPLDTTAGRSVAEASWSPDGSRIAWVARTGDGRQLDVFASRADGSGARNVSRHPADDYHIAWSADGDLLAFTSTRDGNAEIYAYSFRESRLWRLTFDRGQDDRAQFSRSGRFIAFESTRGGTSGVYIMPGLGGDAQRVGGALSLSVGSWESGVNRYVNRVRAAVRSELQPGDTSALHFVALDQLGDSIQTSDPEWTLLDSAFARLLSGGPDSAVRIVALHSGLARVVCNVGRWRYDTAYIRIGNGGTELIGADRGLTEWTRLGVPLPTTSGAEATPIIRLNADREWDSGVLSRASVPLMPGLSVALDIDAPFTAPPDAASGVSVALVAPEESGALDASAPQFLRYAGFSWSAESGRFVYSVGRELFTESSAITRGTPISLLIRVEGDSTMSFSIDGVKRWRSTLRVQELRRNWSANVWLGGRATGDRVKVSGVRVYLSPTQ